MTSKLWEVMNDLDAVTSKICSAREILDCAMDRLQEHQYDKVEQLMYAVDEFLQYYLAEFDEKFKLAWKETVVKQKKEEEDAWDAVNREKEYYEPSMPPWGHSDLEYLVKQSKDKVVKWQLSVQVDGLTGECYVNFPDDLLEAAGLEEGDVVKWVDNNDGSFTIVKVNKTLEMDEC